MSNIQDAIVKTIDGQEKNYDLATTADKVFLNDKEQDYLPIYDGSTDVLTFLGNSSSKTYPSNSEESVLNDEEYITKMLDKIQDNAKQIEQLSSDIADIQDILSDLTIQVQSLTEIYKAKVGSIEYNNETLYFTVE